MIISGRTLKECLLNGDLKSREFSDVTNRSYRVVDIIKSHTGLGFFREHTSKGALLEVLYKGGLGHSKLKLEEHLEDPEIH